jgi:DnaK suppressor protein
MANTKSITRDLKQVQAKLRSQLHELQQRVSLVVKQGRQSGTEDTQDVADQAVASYEKEILFTRGTHENAQLQRIQQALVRVEEGSYGVCQRCEEKIGAKRLEALPWTAYCLACQEKLEQRTERERELVAS